jgi:hypothetical protein
MELRPVTFMTGSMPVMMMLKFYCRGPEEHRQQENGNNIPESSCHGLFPGFQDYLKGDSQ